MRRSTILVLLLAAVPVFPAAAADWEIDFSGWDPASERAQQQIPILSDISLVGGALVVTAPSNMGYFVTEVIHREPDEQWGAFSIEVVTNDATQRFQVDFLDEENNIIAGKTNVRLSSSGTYDLSDEEWGGFRVRVSLYASLLPSGGSPRVTSISVGREGGQVYSSSEFHFYPNPFPADDGENGRFLFSVDGEATVTLKIANTGGKVVRVLKDGVSTSELDSVRPGVCEVEWDGTAGEGGAIVANGTYFCTLVIARSGGGEETRFFKVAVVR